VRAGGKTLTLYTAPTAAGVATIVCSGAVAECGRIAATLRLVDTTTDGPGPSADYGRRVSNVLGKLQGLSGALDRASTQSGQSDAARRIAGALSTAARELSTISPPPAASEAHPKIVSALHGLADAYARLGRAAKSDDSTTYASARRDAETAAEALDRALRGLRALGYTLRS
jgi:hypothetical protein